MSRGERFISNLTFCASEMCHRFSLCCGKNISIKNNGCTACRVRNFNNGLVFSADPLKSDEMFEVSSVCFLINFGPCSQELVSGTS